MVMKLMAAVVAILLASVATTQAVTVRNIIIDASGTIDSTVGSSVEPLVGVGDFYSANLVFNVDTTDTVSGVFGTALINGTSTDITGFQGIFAADTGGVRTRFTLTPFGQGPGVGNVNVDRLEILFRAPSVGTSSIFDILTAPDVSISNLFNVIGTVEVPAGLNESFNIDGDLVSTISSVPLPAALPLFLTALGGLGVMARRRTRPQVTPAD